MKARIENKIRAKLSFKVHIKTKMIEIEEILLLIRAFKIILKNSLFIKLINKLF